MAVSTAFVVLSIASQIAGVTAVILMGVYLGNYAGGFGWGDMNPHKFNYHPLFMTLGLIFIYGDAILVYRVFRNERKIIVKILHAVMQASALGFAIAALVAVFSAHSDEHFPNLYSIHSWVGLATVIMFGMQLVIGFIFYLFPTVSESWKVYYMHLHRYWGVAIFCMAIISAMMGLLENIKSTVGNYGERPTAAYVANFAGVAIIVFGWLVTYLVSKPEYKREAGSTEYAPHINE